MVVDEIKLFEYYLTTIFPNDQQASNTLIYNYRLAREQYKDEEVFQKPKVERQETPYQRAIKELVAMPANNGIVPPTWGNMSKKEKNQWAKIQYYCNPNDQVNMIDTIDREPSRKKRDEPIIDRMNYGRDQYISALERVERDLEPSRLRRDRPMDDPKPGERLVGRIRRDKYVPALERTNREIESKVNKDEIDDSQSFRRDFNPMRKLNIPPFVYNLRERPPTQNETKRMIRKIKGFK